MINWKVRFKNPVFIVTFLTSIVAFIYQTLGLLGYVPAISQDEIMQSITLVVNVLVTLGVLVDPTTKGVNDSDRALDYEEPM